MGKRKRFKFSLRTVTATHQQLIKRDSLPVLNKLIETKRNYVGIIKLEIQAYHYIYDHKYSKRPACLPSTPTYMKVSSSKLKRNLINCHVMLNMAGVGNIKVAQNSFLIFNTNSLID